MSKVNPFCALYPSTSELASEFIAPPYDVLSREEAKEIARKKPNSFIRVTRSEIDLPDSVDPHCEEAYLQAKKRLEHYRNIGIIDEDLEECYNLYKLTWRGRTQIGLMALCDTQEYEENIIKKHELTRPVKEDDRTLHIDTLNAQTGSVFLTYRDVYPELRSILEKVLAEGEVIWTVETEDEVEHSLIGIDTKYNKEIQDAFAKVEALYIADGHHRAAAASRVAKLRNREGTTGYFLAGIFPDSQLEVMAYNRVVHDLNGHSKEEFLTAVGSAFDIEPTESTMPSVRGQITMYLDGKWHLLTPKNVPEDVVGSLDASVLQNQLLSPILGIDNPRTDKRIQFIGGIRGPQALVKAVNESSAVAFHMYPTGMDQLLDVADANRLMPPKSTWFEPKLRGGVMVHAFDATS